MFQFQKWNSSACSLCNVWAAERSRSRVVSIPEVEFLSLLQVPCRHYRDDGSYFGFNSRSGIPQLAPEPLSNNTCKPKRKLCFNSRSGIPQLAPKGTAEHDPKHLYQSFNSRSGIPQLAPSPAKNAVYDCILFQFQKWNSSACSLVRPIGSSGRNMGFNSRSGIPQLAPQRRWLWPEWRFWIVSIPEVEFLSLLHSRFLPLMRGKMFQVSIPEVEFLSLLHFPEPHTRPGFSVMFQFQKWNSSACSACLNLRFR